MEKNIQTAVTANAGKLLPYIPLFLLSAGGLFILCSVFTNDNSLVNGFVIGKICWFNLFTSMFAIGLTFVFFYKKRVSFSVLWPDILVCIMTCVVLLTSNSPVSDPAKLLFIVQLALLWFMLRIALETFPALGRLFLFFILCTGLLEAVLGVQQLYGFRTSAHSLFRLTGTFFNPGPYAGYLSVILPIALQLIVGKDRKSTALYHFGWICVIAALVILPATMSRSAWIAGIAGCAWVGAKKSGVITFLARLDMRLKACICIFVSVLLISLSIGVYFLKKDSADGRLLMWKLTSKALLEHPLGVGLGGFPAVYAETQASYFASGLASNTEKLVAGSPEYAFNEYLHIGLEHGVAGLVLYLVWLGMIIRTGIRNKHTGTVGAIIALSVFAFSSYPFRLPDFTVLLVFLSAISLQGSNGRKITFPAFICAALCLCSLYITYRQRNIYMAYSEWNSNKMIYNRDSDNSTFEKYDRLYPYLKYEPRYLFEYSLSLDKSGEHIRAIELLKQATKLSSDPMIWYMLAKNEQAEGEYANSEKHLLHAIDILPERIYPWYLLARLYMEPDFMNGDKLSAAVDSVLYKKPKVLSTAVLEMRDEMRKINIQNIP